MPWNERGSWCDRSVLRRTCQVSIPLPATSPKGLNDSPFGTVLLRLADYLGPKMPRANCVMRVQTRRGHEGWSLDGNAPEATLRLS